MTDENTLSPAHDPYAAARSADVPKAATAGKLGRQNPTTRHTRRERSRHCRQACQKPGLDPISPWRQTANQVGPRYDKQEGDGHGFVDCGGLVAQALYQPRTLGSRNPHDGS